MITFISSYVNVTIKKMDSLISFIVVLFFFSLYLLMLVIRTIIILNFNNGELRKLVFYVEGVRCCDSVFSSSLLSCLMTESTHDTCNVIKHCFSVIKTEESLFCGNIIVATWESTFYFLNRL